MKTSSRTSALSLVAGADKVALRANFAVRGACVSVIYNYIERDIEVNDLRPGPAGNPPQSVSKFVNLGSDSRVNVVLTRIVAWLLPFLNLTFRF